MLKRVIPPLLIMVVVVAALSLLYQDPRPMRPPPPYIGRWEGRCGLNGERERLPDLDVDLEIDGEGSLSGRIGEAAISGGGFLGSNPLQVWIGRPRYLIRAELTGFLYPDIDITLASVLFTPPDLAVADGAWFFHSVDSESGGSAIRSISSDGFDMFKRGADTLIGDAHTE